MPLALILAAGVSLMLSGAIFGFFYAWVCSTMWGLDAADPRVAIPAMQAMNASVRNAVFAPAFFGTGPMLIVTAVIAFALRYRAAAFAFGAAAAVSIAGGTVLTMVVHVPMNEALAMVDVPEDIGEARAIWEAYSPSWQRWNVSRTVLTGIVLALTGAGIAKAAASARPS